MTSENRKDLLPTLSRTSPVLFAIILFANCIITPTFESFYIFIMYFVIMLSNFFAKVLVFKPLYNFLGTTKIKGLGLGIRPNGANSCGFILDGKESSSFGMPSGHSQIAWTIITYVILKIICKIKEDFNKDENEDENEDTTVMKYIWLCISCILLIIIAIYISYSRVYIEGCHTIQQVSIGGVLGVGCGFLLYYIEDYVKKLLTL